MLQLQAKESTIESDKHYSANLQFKLTTDALKGFSHIQRVKESMTR